MLEIAPAEQAVLGNDPQRIGRVGEHAAAALARPHDQVLRNHNVGSR